MLKLRQSIEAKKKQFDLEIAGAKSSKAAGVILRDKKRWLCHNDLYFLASITRQRKIVEYENIYRDFCDEVSTMNWVIIKNDVQPALPEMLKIEDVTDDPETDLKDLQRLYLAYRAFYKTTIVTKLHSLQLLLNFPNIHIILCHNKQENSSDNLVAIKNCFLTTEIRILFPEYIPKGKEWGNQSGFSVAIRNDWNRTEQNIEAVGVDTEITGRHYQVAKKNDLVTEKSVNTEDQIRKSLDWDERFNIGMWDDAQRKIQDYEGTRYHLLDMYSTKKNDPKIKLIEIPLLKDQNHENLSIENIQNPERYTPEGILSLMSDMWVFNSQMLMKPDDPAKRNFKQEMIAYFFGIPSCNFYLLVDPASKRKKKSDFTAMLVVGVSAVGKYNIVDGIRDKLDPKQRIDMAIGLAIKWNIKESGWEEVGLGDDNFYLEEARRKARLYFSVTPIKSMAVAKEDRIRNILVPDYSQHKWLWPPKGSVVKNRFDGRSYDLTEDMEREFLHFPLSEHDDLLDAMTFLSRLNVVKPQETKEDENKEMTFGEYGKIRDDRLALNRSNPWASIGRG